MGENPTQEPKNLLNYPTKKISFIKFTSSAFKYVISSPTKEWLSSNYPLQASFLVVAMAVVSLFNFRLYAHMCYANFD